jgi:hypothetical protein
MSLAASIACANHGNRGANLIGTALQLKYVFPIVN